jgi:hypothetical protein
MSNLRWTLKVRLCGSATGSGLAIGPGRLQGRARSRSGDNEMDKRQPSRNAELGLSTRAIHHGYDPAEEHGALTPPIFMTSTYAFETAEAGSELFRASRRARAP